MSIGDGHSGKCQPGTPLPVVLDNAATEAQMPNYYGIPNYYVVRRIVVATLSTYGVVALRERHDHTIEQYEALRDPVAEPVQREARPSAPPMPVGLNYLDQEVDEPDDWWVAADMSMGTPLALMASLDEENA